MKTFVLTVSRTFPKTHKRAGEETFFVEKIFSGQAETNPEFKIEKSFVDYDFQEYYNAIPKLHTCRSNYELWAKRVKEIQEGKAILSIRYWSGKPYNSKQVEICQLDKNSGIGVQILFFDECKINKPLIADSSKTFILPSLIAKNDGLSLEDFKEWFRKYDLSKPMAIIHFTNFRY